MTQTVTVLAVLTYCGAAPTQMEVQRALAALRAHRERSREHMREKRKGEREKVAA